ncbi:hypothetical protein B0H34DRAFT_518410 [Crassisporium funariophilum]|nr:hypothetical protein B0H34DRAFT_518410 [Crassisporium funariophilum]
MTEPAIKACLESSWTNLLEKMRESYCSQDTTDGIAYAAPYSTLPEYLGKHEQYFGNNHSTEDWIAWNKETLTDEWDRYEKKRVAYEEQYARRAQETEDIVLQKVEEARKVLMRTWMEGEERRMEEDERVWRERRTELEREMDEAVNGLSVKALPSPKLPGGRNAMEKEKQQRESLEPGEKERNMKEELEKREKWEKMKRRARQKEEMEKREREGREERGGRRGEGGRRRRGRWNFLLPLPQCRTIGRRRKTKKSVHQKFLHLVSSFRWLLVPQVPETWKPGNLETFKVYLPRSIRSCIGHPICKDLANRVP